MDKPDFKLKIKTTMVTYQEISSRSYPGLTGAQALDQENELDKDELIQAIVESLSYLKEEDISVTRDVQLVVTSD